MGLSVLDSKSCRKLFAVAVVAAASQAVAAAAEDWQTEFLQCAEGGIEAERLECFDELAARLTASQAVLPDAAVQAFGGETVADRQLDKQTQVDEIRTTIEDVERRPRGEYVFLLDNGQTWTEVSPGRAHYRPGMEVRVERTTLGGYMLSTDSGRATRVRRIR